MINMTCGIYLITNKKTNQKYVGQSINIERRWKEHAQSKNIKSSYLDRAIKKYNINIFELKILEELPNDTDILNQREQYWIKYYNTYENKKDYNLTIGGDFNPAKVPSIAKKISKNHRDVSGINNPMYGRKGDKHPLYGKHRTQETRNKISQSLKEKNKYKKSKNRKLTNKQECKIIDLYLDGIPKQQLISKYNISDTTFSNIFKRHKKYVEKQFYS